MPPILAPFRKRPWRSAAAAVLLAAALPALSACHGGGAVDPPLAGTALGGDFTLVDKTGKTVRYADFAGKWRVLYFGYTFCPDICPLDVQHLMQGYHLFARAHPAQAARVVPMFISIDPARDTPQVVGQFASAFGPELVGLTGTPQQVAVAAKAFAVYYQKHAGSTPDAYLMDHSRASYLMDPDGKPVALLPVDQDGKAVAAELEKWVR
ncbi:electron transport protein SCO1/SenC [Novosphingobium nitrogenifigens DSM 19370]|uniref:Electron transport protein SCO1/SenC n=1 Tax=Novosphingobium nitrogenifigens DSM 19370 TaxID=983920 RepID=F1ZBN7_9SPHN|nr:SCO family protein [Novosphingobium nitrogenifigens]EGD57879.1 electron transport protein SCO1/SenC [Novosphingobium nitrogenifigens DSM 19370]